MKGLAGCLLVVMAMTALAGCDNPAPAPAPAPGPPMPPGGFPSVPFSAVEAALDRKFETLSEELPRIVDGVIQPMLIQVSGDTCLTALGREWVRFGIYAPDGARLGALRLDCPPEGSSYSLEWLRTYADFTTRDQIWKGSVSPVFVWECARTPTDSSCVDPETESGPIKIEQHSAVDTFKEFTSTEKRAGVYVTPSHDVLYVEVLNNKVVPGTQVLIGYVRFCQGVENESSGNEFNCSTRTVGNSTWVESLYLTSGWINSTTNRVKAHSNKNMHLWMRGRNGTSTKIELCAKNELDCAYRVRKVRYEKR